MTTKYSPGQLDAMAREQGFPDYVTWIAWNKKRSANLRTPQNYQVAQPQQKNFLQSLLSQIPPFSIIGHVADRYGQATGEN